MNFEELAVWKKSRILCREIFEITCRGNFLRDYKLKDQINAASGSIMDNIAEGFGRQGNSEFIQFLSIANGSAMEVRSQLYRALDRNYILQEKFDSLIAMVDEINKMLISFIAYLGKSDFRGQKFKVRGK